MNIGELMFIVNRNTLIQSLINYGFEDDNVDDMVDALVYSIHYLRGF